MVALRRLLLGLALLAAGAAAGVALHTSLTQGDTLFAGKRPKELGPGTGRLAPCTAALGCVSSQAHSKDPLHAVAPIAVKGNSFQAMAAVRKAVESMPRATVVRIEPGYLYAEFRSRLMGFVDDVEFLFDPAAGMVHVRAASRLGRPDFGAHRERVDRLRSLLEKRISS